MKNAPVYILLLVLLLVYFGQHTPRYTDQSNPAYRIKRTPKYIAIKMKILPSTDDPIVLRTDFSNENQWKKVCDEIVTPNAEFGFLPNVVFASDTSFQNYTEEQLLSDTTSEYDHAFIFIVDNITLSNPEHPVLCLGLKHNRGMKLRTIPSEMWGIENNLSISNMDFEEFVHAVDEDGIFRGF